MSQSAAPTRKAISGTVAQFGRGVLADVSARLLDEFVACLGSTVLVSAADDADGDDAGGDDAVTAPPAGGEQDPGGSQHDVPVRRVLDQLWLASQRYVRLFVSDTLSVAMDDHRELLACSEGRDGDRASEVLRRHLDRTELAVRQAFTPADEAQAD